VHPVLLDLGFEFAGQPVRFYTYGLCMALGVIMGVAIFVNKARRYHEIHELVLLTIVTFIAGFLGSKILFILVNLEYYEGLAPWVVGGIELPPVKHYFMSGMVWYGGVVFGIPAALVFCLVRKLRFVDLADAAAPTLSLGHLWGRIGCFFAGCCYGAPTDLPWGVRFPRESVAFMELLKEHALPPGSQETIALHPTQLYEVGAEFFIFITLIVFSRFQRFKGQTAGLYLACYGIFRFVVEFFRNDPSRGAALGVSTSQWIAVVLLVIGTALFVRGWVFAPRELDEIE
jgi:phosphatidylglycerol:prolipoprotein diacylglycerol transferase